MASNESDRSEQLSRHGKAIDTIGNEQMEHAILIVRLMERIHSLETHKKHSDTALQRQHKRLYAIEKAFIPEHLADIDNRCTKLEDWCTTITARIDKT